MMFTTTFAYAQELPTEPEPRTVEVESGRWFDVAKGRMVLTEDEKAESVKKVLLQMDYEDDDGWSSGVKGEGFLSGDETTNLEVYAAKEFGSAVRTFAAWKRESGIASVRTGLEGTIFGSERIRVARLLHPSQAELDATEVSVKLNVTDRNVVQLQSTHSEKGAEVGGEIHRKVNSGLDLGASFTTRRDHTQEGSYGWSFPRMEGRLRWTW